VRRGLTGDAIGTVAGFIKGGVGEVECEDWDERKEIVRKMHSGGVV
jgi:hypothetical protein